MKTALALVLALAASIAAASVTVTAGIAATPAPIPAPHPAVRQWPLPWRSSHPRAPFVGPDGRVWFAAQRGDYLGSFDPATEDFQRLDLAPGTAPEDLVMTPEGRLFFTGSPRARIGLVESAGLLESAGTTVQQIDLPGSDARDPGGLTLDRNGHLYFTASDAGLLGRMALDSHDVVLVQVPTDRARPYGLVMDAAGTVWSPELGANKLAKLNPDTLSVSEVVLPRDSSRPRRLAATSDGRIWYVDHATGMLGFLHPASGLFKEYPLPGGSTSRPFGLAADRHDMLWVVESGSSSADRLLAFDPVSESFTEAVDLPSGGGTVRHLCYDPTADALWFVTDDNTLGRASLYPPPP